MIKQQKPEFFKNPGFFVLEFEYGNLHNRNFRAESKKITR